MAAVVGLQSLDQMWRSLAVRLSIASCLNLSASAIAGLFGLESVGVFSVLCMIEGALLLIASGGLDLVSSIFGTEVRKLLSKGNQDYSADRHKKEQKRAMGLVLLGFSLLTEAIVVSLLFGG